MKILMHTCCAPCLLGTKEALTTNTDCELTAFFYNPNIFPREEGKKRLSELYKIADALIVEEDDTVPTYFAPGNCETCYRMRLTKTAEKARELGFEAFSTTLLTSPYQKHDLLKAVGEDIALTMGIPFYYGDFRPGFRAGQSKARDLELYRQKYCGCRSSFEERTLPHGTART